MTPELTKQRDNCGGQLSNSLIACQFFSGAHKRELVEEILAFHAYGGNVVLPRWALDVVGTRLPTTSHSMR